MSLVTYKYRIMNNIQVDFIGNQGFIGKERKEFKFNQSNKRSK